MPVLKGEEAVIGLNLLFDNFFGLAPAPDKLGPLSSIAMSENEEYGRNGPMYTMMELYAKSGIGEFFPGLSFPEFISLPREATMWLLEISENLRKNKGKETDGLINGLKNLTK